MAKFYKNKFFLALTISGVIFLVLKGIFMATGIELGLGGTFTQKRALITSIALFSLLFLATFSAIKGKVGLFNLFLILFSFVFIEGIIEEKGGEIGIRRTIKTIAKKQESDSAKVSAPKAKTTKKKLVANQENTTNHSLLGYSLIPGEFLIAKNCYKVVYTNTKDSIRYNPIVNETAKKAALFGCSFTYGTGIDDEHTLSANLAQVDTTRNYLNFGQEGFGMQQMLSNLDIRAHQNKALAKTLEAADLGIYFYLEDHIYRLLGKNHLVSYHWGTDFPFYEANLENNTVKLDGKLGNQLSLLQRVSYFPVHISLVYKKLYYRFIYAGPEALKKTDFQKAALVIKEAKAKFLETGTNKRFLVVLFPNTDNSDNGRIKTYLTAQNIEVVDLSKLIKKDDVPDYIVCKNDPHPNAKLNKLVSEKIVEILTTDNSE